MHPPQPQGWATDKARASTKTRRPALANIVHLAMDPLHKLLDKATQMGLLHPIGADDMVLFLRPIATDVAHLQQLLHSFGTATGLCKNIQK
jgi:hypothetical protein